LSGAQRGTLSIGSLLALIGCGNLRAGFFAGGMSTKGRRYLYDMFRRKCATGVGFAHALAPLPPAIQVIWAALCHAHVGTSFSRALLASMGSGNILGLLAGHFPAALSRCHSFAGCGCRVQCAVTAISAVQKIYAIGSGQRDVIPLLFTTVAIARFKNDHAGAKAERSQMFDPELHRVSLFDLCGAVDVCPESPRWISGLANVANAVGARVDQGIDGHVGNVANG
jgi:hypothetical protein